MALKTAILSFATVLTISATAQAYSFMQTCQSRNQTLLNDINCQCLNQAYQNYAPFVVKENQQKILQLEEHLKKEESRIIRKIGARRTTELETACYATQILDRQNDMTTLERRRAIQQTVASLNSHSLSEKFQLKNRDAEHYLKNHIRQMSQSTNGRSEKYCEILNEIEILKKDNGQEQARILKSKNPGSAMATLMNKGICE